MKSVDSYIEKSNLLNSLHPSDIALLRPYLEPVSLEAGKILYEPGDIVNHAYLPCGPTLISFLVLLDDARGVETALIGREGAVGGIVSHGHLPAYCRAVVQFPGPALKIESTNLEKTKAASSSLLNFFTRYADCLLSQIFQTVACNATHTIEQRTAKWLIAAMDRTGDHTVPLTQEQLAGMLGVGRSYVAHILGNLKERGTLETLRGKLQINKLKELKAISCSCNELVQLHFNDVLKGVYPQDAGI